MSCNLVLTVLQHELNCHQCHRQSSPGDGEQDCRECYFSQTPAVHDRFYLEAVRPYIWFAAVLLFLSYVIGLFFTLRTHAAVIWNSELDEKKQDKLDLAASHMAGTSHHDFATRPETISRNDTSGTLPRGDIRESQLYKRILGQSLKQVGLSPHAADTNASRQVSAQSQGGESHTPHVVPPKSSHADNMSQRSIQIHGLSEEENNNLVIQVAEMAATAAAVAARDATKAPRKAAQLATTPGRYHADRPHVQRSATFEEDPADAAHAAQGGGHDAPNWSRTKSAVILLTATLAYAIIAEILVNTVDAVLENVDIDEKFLGITLFALVPNTTEFLVSRHSVSGRL